VHGVVGIKGLAVNRCEIDRSRLTEEPADPEHGYWWPYLLVTSAPRGSDAPRTLGAGTLFVAPNNSGAATDDIELLRASAICELGSGSNAGKLAIADSLGTPILVPLIPRPELRAESSNLQLQALARASFDESLDPKFKRVDLQLTAMIDAARKKLAATGQPIQTRVLMAGFSASGAFTNRFTVLHPERVLAAAAGSPGGWPIAPVAVDQGDALRYPVGIADVKELTGQAVDLDALRRVRLLFFLGDLDDNDSVGSRDSFSDADSALINHRFGDKLVARWWPAQRLYNSAGLEHVEFKIYHGVGHEITPEMWNDILNTFCKALSAP
jgi:dienelactone hydrolase